MTDDRSGLPAGARLAARDGPRVDITEILDYDDSDHVVVAAATMLQSGLRLGAALSPGARRALFWLVHWGYGSAVGAATPSCGPASGSRRPGLAFLVGCQTMALSLFPLLGDTPVPWRWGPRLLTVSIAQHAVYAAAVAGADAVLARRAP